MHHRQFTYNYVKFWYWLIYPQKTTTTTNNQTKNKYRFPSLLLPWNSAEFTANYCISVKLRGGYNHAMHEWPSLCWCSLWEKANTKAYILPWTDAVYWLCTAGMTGVFPWVPTYYWCDPLLHPSSCMLVNHGPSQQSSKEEYKPWKWGATARYCASHTKSMLPTRKSMPRSSRQLDHTKTPWLL